MATTINLNPYKISWALFVPHNGRFVPKRDMAKMRRVAADYTWLERHAKQCVTHFGSKERALAYIESLQGRLSKDYAAYIFTDKQFGMACPANKGKKNAMRIDVLGNYVKLTQMQVDNRIEIKAK